MKTLIFDTDGTLKRVVADSALAFNRRPWFVPDFNSGWRASFGLAVRISRLGKGVTTQFAHRYYDAVTVAMLPSCDHQEPLLSYMDGAVVIGDWLTGITPGQINAGDNSATAPTSAAIDNAIALASHTATLKTGDIIILPVALHEFIIERNQHITATIGSQLCLDFNIR